MTDRIRPAQRLERTAGPGLVRCTLDGLVDHDVPGTATVTVPNPAFPADESADEWIATDQKLHGVRPLRYGALEPGATVAVADVGGEPFALSEEFHCRGDCHWANVVSYRADTGRIRFFRWIKSDPMLPNLAAGGTFAPASWDAWEIQRCGPHLAVGIRAAGLTAQAGQIVLLTARGGVYRRIPEFQFRISSFNHALSQNADEAHLLAVGRHLNNPSAFVLRHFDQDGSTVASHEAAGHEADACYYVDQSRYLRETADDLALVTFDGSVIWQIAKASHPTFIERVLCVTASVAFVHSLNGATLIDLESSDVVAVASGNANFGATDGADFFGLSAGVLTRYDAGLGALWTQPVSLGLAGLPARPVCAGRGLVFVGGLAGPPDHAQIRAYRTDDGTEVWREWAVRAGTGVGGTPRALALDGFGNLWATFNTGDRVPQPDRING